MEESYKSAHFRTNVLIKSILGKDLITDDYVAVLELVKNSFDAGSPLVDIYFENIKTNSDFGIREKIAKTNEDSELDGGGELGQPISKRQSEEHELYANEVAALDEGGLSRIIIYDKGDGMDSDDLENKWLNIAFSEKKLTREKFGRTMAGNKGVGRFSCDRLGVFLDIFTKRKTGPIYQLRIDWRRFEIEGDLKLEIQKIPVTIRECDNQLVQKITGKDIDETGTILCISRLRSFWSQQRIGELRKQLEKLINPNQVFEADKFKIQIFAQDFVTEDKFLKPGARPANGPIANQVFSNLSFRATNLECVVSDDGLTIRTSLVDRNRRVYEIVEKNEEFQMLKGIRIVLYYLNQYSKAYFKRSTGIRSGDFGSIFLFINGFRVPPYGDQGDDWLGLEKRKSQGQKRFFGTREVLGRVEISDSEGIFKIISSRTGVVENEPFQQLVGEKSLFKRALRRLERYVVEGISWDSVPKGAVREQDIENDPTWSEANEIFIKSETERTRQIVQNLLPTIDVKSNATLSLTIDEEFVSEVVDRERKEAASKVERLFGLLKEDNSSPEEIRQNIESISKEVSSIEMLANSLRGALTASRAEMPRIGELSEIKKELDDWVVEANRIQLEKERVEKEKAEAEELLRIERERSTYLLSSSKGMSSDASDLIHTIKLTSVKVEKIVDNLLDAISNGKLKSETLIQKLVSIKLETRKVLALSKIITRANFRKDLVKIDIDLVKYVHQYISEGIFWGNRRGEKLRFIFENEEASFFVNASPLELTIILDNLIDNSMKASAKTATIRFELSEDAGKLKLFFGDDGNGVDAIFLNNPNLLFQVGITTTDGSGIGLAAVKALMIGMGGDIVFCGNGLMGRGATFCLTFN